jgi:DNA-binding CsgD family transcriptional regulator
MALTEADLLRLALLTYEAATEPALWPRFLALCNDAISSDITLLQIHDLGLHKSNILSSFGISSPLSQAYNEYYSRLNIWRDGGRALYAAGAVNLDPEMCSRSLFERSEFYNEYLRRMDGTYCLGAVIARRQNQAPTLTALRGRQKGEFGEDERKVAKFLLPHLARAWTVHEKLELLAAGESIVDRLSLGIVFLKPGGVAVYSNRFAEEIFRSDDGLSMRNARLVAWDRAADGQLHQAVCCAVSPDRPVGPQGVGVPRASGRRAYQVVVAPIRARFRQFTGTPAPAAVALIRDPERPEPAKRELLIQLFGLTSKEAEMTIELSEAKSVEQAANEMGITYQTARTHLRRIFSKTETSRQSELLLLIARLPGEGG